MLVVGVLTQPDLYEKMVSNLVEAKSRGAYIMGLTTYGNYSIEDTANFTVYVPKTDPHFATSLSVVPLQLLAYYVSCAAKAWMWINPATLPRALRLNKSCAS